MKIIPVAFTSRELSDLQSILDLAASRLPRSWTLDESPEQGDFHIISMDGPEEFSRHLKISPNLDPRRIIAYIPEETTVEARWILRKRPNSPPLMSELRNLLANIERYLQGLDTETVEGAPKGAEENRQTIAGESASRNDTLTETLVSPPDSSGTAEDMPSSPTSMAEAEDTHEDTEENRRDAEDDSAGWDGLSTIALAPSSSFSFEADNAPPFSSPMAEPGDDPEHNEERRRHVEDDLADWDGLSTIVLMPSSSLAFEAEDSPPARPTIRNGDPRADTENTPMRHTASPSAPETAHEEPSKPEHATAMVAEDFGPAVPEQQPGSVEVGGADDQPASDQTSSTLLQRIGEVFKGKRPDSL
jgi:hypothetical protein